MVGKVVIAYFVLLGFVVNAQPLDTLKIKAEADSLMTVADSLEKAWQLNEALELYQTTLNKYQQIGDRSSEGGSLNNVGNVYNSLSDYSKAMITMETGNLMHFLPIQKFNQ